MGSRGNSQLQDNERSCTIPSPLGRLYEVQRHMGNQGPPVQLCGQAQGVAAEVPQKAMRRTVGLTMTSGKRLPNRNLLEMELFHVTFYTSYLSPFPMSSLARGLVFNGHGMHV